MSGLSESEKLLQSSSRTAAVRQRTRTRWPSLAVICTFPLIVLLLFARLEGGLIVLQLPAFPPPHRVFSLVSEAPRPPPDACPQPAPLFPTRRNAAIWETIRTQTASDAFKLGPGGALELLAGAVQIPTESYDDMHPIGLDPRWEVFADFHAYLARVFPRVHTTLKLRKINTYGLWFEWPGADPSLKPVLFMAHQDVVPIDPTTVGEWTHPPYSGHFDGHRIWGRGSADDKNGLVGILIALETLLHNGFTPTRTVVAAFGFDEEASGLEGAGALAGALLDAYGAGGVALILDEGDGIANTSGTAIAYPCVAEKGYLDVVVEVTAAGGHSSVPPAHTTIGILAALLVQYEANPYPVQLSRASTPLQTLQCLAQHAGRALSPALRALIRAAPHSDEALRALAQILAADRLYRSQLATTQAATVVRGGVTANALPEAAHAVVNHRILTESSVAEVRAHNTAALRPLAARFNLSFTAFGVPERGAPAPARGTLVLRDMYDALEPAPVSPTDSGAYALLSGSIKAAYATRAGAADGSDAVVVAPAVMVGNTDTQFYWKLSPHIFRYGHGNAAAGLAPDEILDKIHTVDESIDADDFVEMIRFFLTLILNADESVVL